MNDITIKFNKITKDETTWPPEGRTVLLSDGTCIIRVGNKARGINSVVDDFILHFIDMSWGNIPTYLISNKPAMFPVDVLPEKKIKDDRSRVVVIKYRGREDARFNQPRYTAGLYDYTYKCWSYFGPSLTEFDFEYNDFLGWMEVPE